ncbi:MULTISPECIES: galactan 5-O-arabinofuranosyltransferase [unclassified Corynebacterium]|uniref:galactan 5-O-arabinofuranosyltransferase n=1 Tax=unclassified Corynebacterium TaxID=2624378 RepID=UPI001EF57020|nr:MULTISPECIES: galactan 5-O-arabinofuranosyltransferase [unclassified Corynebacterium]MCG7259167.1 galactan 5-O-arabinofuranosyltransferase [Corynebacterium sp. ACRQK]MCG7263465.1 galactan 5-O-arabinofuranosyltransferase [Corynebacterium sp. ACRQL]
MSSSSATQADRTVPFTKDALSVRQTLVRLVATAALAFAGTTLGWYLMAHTNFPAFTNSFVLRGLTTAAIVILIVFTGLACYWWIYPAKWMLSGQTTSARGAGARGSQRPALRGWVSVLLQLVMHLAPAMLVLAALGIPLAATQLYLGGISVDQAFRTQFLTRMTDQLGWEDMAYIDQPSFYPGLWFFSGGLFARAFGLTGWVAMQPWALITMAMAASMLVPVWQRICGSLPIASALALMTAAVTLTVGGDEPYAAIVAMGMAPAFIIARRALHGGRVALLGSIIYLGLSANLYTLYTAISALTVVVVAVVGAITVRGTKPLIRLVAIGVGSIAIALLGWAPYLWSLVTQPHGSTNTAQHYLPEVATQVPTPFFESAAIGILSIIALIWMVFRRKDGDVRALTLGLVVCYAWVILSLLMTVFGTTLLGFRVAVPISIILAVSGVLAIADWRLVYVPQLMTAAGRKPENGVLISRVIAIVMAVCGIHYATQIPYEHENHIDTAYTDTDGEGKRADKLPGDSAVYYSQVDEVLSEELGGRSGKVLLTDEKSFMAYYPYHGYQAFTSHYANPLGDFARRNEEIEGWSKITDPKDLLAAMDDAEKANGWKTPDALLMRGQLDSAKGSADSTDDDGTFTYLVSDDIYPSQPNVRFRAIHFDASAFSEGWNLHQVGPFVIAVRQR